MPLARIPPPPRPATATPPQQQQQQPAQLGHGDLLASFDQEQVPPTDTNPHLQMYNGPTADFFSSPSAPEPATPTNSQSHTGQPPRQTQHTAHSPPHTHTHTHTHTHSRHPPRRLSQIFSSLGPASPPVVSEQAGNGFILPPHHHHHSTNHATLTSTSTSDVPGNDEFGAFTSAAASSSSSAATAGGEHREKSRPQEPHRRLSSFEELWNLVPGGVATFPRRAGTGGALERPSTTMAVEDELHEDQKEAEQVSHAQTQSSSASGSGSGFTGLSDLLRSRSRDPTPVPAPPAPSSSSTTSKLGNVLGTTIKAASKWKTIRGPSSFHPIPSSFTEEQPPPASTRSGYALRHPFIEDADDFTPPGFRPPPMAKPFVITHASPFASSTTTTTTGSSSLSPPRRGLMGAPLTGAPGFRAEDTYLGSTRPVSSTTDDDRRQGGAGGMGGGVGVGNADADAGEKNGSSTDGQNGSSAGAEGREWTGTKLVGRREGTDVVLDQAGADALRPSLPPRQRLSRTWTMLYSTDQHGASLTTFYRLLETHSRKNPQAGNVLVVRDAAGRRFGVFMNEGIRRAEGTYAGSGESWLYKLFQEDDDDSRTRAHVFRWTGKNHYFALCESEFISFGGGDGRYGLWIDKNLYHGSSAPCPAYDNEVLCAPPGSKAQRGTFECYGLEVWATS